MVLGTFLVIVAIALVLGYISMYNSIKIAKLKVSEALSGIDIALTKRYDVLTKMLDVVKGYKTHELQVLTDVIKLRSGMTMKERNEASSQMDNLFGQIRAIVESYPELKSSANFEHLQKTVVDVEEHLQAARRLYNSNVTRYNKLVVTFPGSIIASGMGATPEEYFVADESKRSDVKMEF